jgi:telomere length regulation protein
MDDLLTPVRTTYLDKEKPSIREIKSTEENTETRPTRIESPEQALEVLRSEPDYSLLITVLRYLKNGITGNGLFNLARPSPISAQLVQVLVTDIRSNYWTLLKEQDEDQDETKSTNSDLQLFLKCLQNIPGVNATLLHIRALTREAKAGGNGVSRPDISLNLRTTLELLSELLQGSECAARTWALMGVREESLAKRRSLEQEFLALFGSGRVVSFAAEAEEILLQTEKLPRFDNSIWLANSAEYSKWLARNISSWISHDLSNDESRLCSELLAKTLRLGYIGWYSPCRSSLSFVLRCC